MERTEEKAEAEEMRRVSLLISCMLSLLVAFGISVELALAASRLFAPLSILFLAGFVIFGVVRIKRFFSQLKKPQSKELSEQEAIIA